MEKIKKGDKVGRISYGKDIIFEVIRIINLGNGKKIAILKGITERIEVDSDVDDLVLIEKESVDLKLRSLDIKVAERIKKKTQKKKIENRAKDEFLTGKILHLDGDRKYSEKSLKYYQQVGLNAIVKNIPEYRQPKMIYNLLMYYKPDIVVITGHDRNDKKRKQL